MAIPFVIIGKVGKVVTFKVQAVSMYNMFQDDGFGECLNTNFICTREVTASVMSFLHEGLDERY